MRLKTLAAMAAFALTAGAGSAAQAQSSFDRLTESVQTMQYRLWGTYYSNPLLTQISHLAQGQQHEYTVTPPYGSYGDLQAYATCGGCGDIDLYLWDAYEQRFVAQDDATDAQPQVRYYPTDGRSYVIRVVMYNCPANSCWYTMTAVR